MSNGARSRTKGHNFERQVARLFRDALPGAEVRRGLQSRGEESPDVDVPGYWIECKRGKQPNLRAALLQAIEAAQDGRVPVAIVKDDRREPIVVLRLEDFLALLRT